MLIISSVANSAEYSSQASNPNVNNEKPEKGSQAKRIHPHALKLIPVSYTHLTLPTTPYV